MRESKYLVEENSERGMIALRVQDPAASHTGHSWHPDLRKDGFEPGLRRTSIAKVAQRDIWCSYRNAFAVHSDEPGFSDVFLRQQTKRRQAFSRLPPFLSSATFYRFRSVNS
jgi:hypothetical protein